MTDEKAIYESGISPLKVGDVLQGGEDDFIQVLAPSEKTNKYWCIHLDGSGFMEFDRALMYKFGWRLVEGAPTIAQLLEAANPHTQTALNTLRDVVPGEYRSVTGMVDYAREAIEERDALRTSVDEQSRDGSERKILDQIIETFRQNPEVLWQRENAILDDRYVWGHVSTVVSQCAIMGAQFDRLRAVLGREDPYAEMMDQAIEAIEFKRKPMTPREPVVILPDPSPTQVDVVRCLMGLEPGSSAGDIIAAWAERNPESAYQQGRADAYRDIAKGGE